jgi:hypothetical protein
MDYLSLYSVKIYHYDFLPHHSQLVIHDTQVGFEVLMAVSTKMTVFWVVVPCSLVEVYRRFRGP